MLACVCCKGEHSQTALTHGLSLSGKNDVVSDNFPLGLLCSKHSSNLRTRLSMCLSGVDSIRSVLANNLPASYFPTFSASDPDADGYSVQVLPSLQVQMQTARHIMALGQLYIVNYTCSVFHKLMPGQLRLACRFKCMSCGVCSLWPNSAYCSTVC